jgi:ribosomal protein L11 methyltransferase
MTRSLQRVAFVVPASRAEEARAVLIDLAPSGFEERELAGAVELAVYADAEEARLVRERFPPAVVTDVAPCWEDAWRAFHRPVVAGGVWIGPPWETPPPDTPSVVIDPGRAFGTGAHPTTRLCVELLASAPRGALLDVGCGSGVLALAGSRLGYGPVVAVDNDPVAVAVTRENAARNGVELEAGLVDATGDELPVADVTVANILLAPVEAVLGRLRAGVAITSGYLESDRPQSRGWSRDERRVLDGWAADRWTRPVSV